MGTCIRCGKVCHNQLCRKCYYEERAPRSHLTFKVEEVTSPEDVIQGETEEQAVKRRLPSKRGGKSMN